VGLVVLADAPNLAGVSAELFPRDHVPELGMWTPVQFAGRVPETARTFTDLIEGCVVGHRRRIEAGSRPVHAHPACQYSM